MGASPSRSVRDRGAENQAQQVAGQDGALAVTQEVAAEVTGRAAEDRDDTAAVPLEAKRRHEQCDDRVRKRGAAEEGRHEEEHDSGEELRGEDAGHVAVRCIRHGTNHAVLPCLREGHDAESGEDAGQHEAPANAREGLHRGGHGGGLGPAGEDAQDIEEAVDRGECTDVRVLQDLELPLLRGVAVERVLGVEVAVEVDTAGEHDRECGEAARDEEGVQPEAREDDPGESAQERENDADQREEAHRVFHAVLVPVGLRRRDPRVGRKGDFQ